jgi:hypothetical protein
MAFPWENDRRPVLVTEGRRATSQILRNDAQKHDSYNERAG